MKRWPIENLPLDEVAETLANGGVLLLPTDTIYGLHAVAANERAVARIKEMKGRDETKPFIVLASRISQLPDLGISAAPELLTALNEIWPAPLTAILPCLAPRADRWSGGLQPAEGRDALEIGGLKPAAPTTVAVRIPDLEWLRNLVELTGPLVSTSANRSGEPAITRPENLAHDLLSALDGVVDAGPREGKASAILDLTRDEPRFIREGDVSFTQKVWKTLRKSL